GGVRALDPVRPAGRGTPIGATRNGKPTCRGPWIGERAGDRTTAPPHVRRPDHSRIGAQGLGIPLLPRCLGTAAQRGGGRGESPVPARWSSPFAPFRNHR